MSDSRWRWRCENKGCYLADRWMLTELDGVLPRGIGFSDIDGYAEVNGRFLFLEHKPVGYAWDEGNGQWNALKRLARLPGVTVWWLRDREDGGFDVAEPGEQLARVTLEELRERARQWGAQASDETPGVPLEPR